MLLNHLSHLSFLLVIICLISWGIHSNNCNKCQKSKNVAFACHNENTFSICIHDVPTRAFIRCPAGRVCTDNPSVCMLRNEPMTGPSCPSQCGKCSSYRNVFSCLNETTIGFCFGYDEPMFNSTQQCLDGFVCDLNNRKFCSEASLAVPSCLEDFFNSTEASLRTSTEKQSSSAITKDVSRTTINTNLTPTRTTAKANFITETSVDVELLNSTTTIEAPSMTTVSNSFTTTVTKATVDSEEDPLNSTTTIEAPSMTPVSNSFTTTATKATVESEEDPLNSTIATTETAIFSTKEQTTTTTSHQTGRDPTTFCNQIKKNGFFPSETDTTCKKYVGCGENGKPHRSTPYSCKNGKFFNGTHCERVTFPPECLQPLQLRTTTTLTNTAKATTKKVRTKFGRDAATFCKETRKVGVFPSETDTTCTKFICCSQLGNTFSSVEYTCKKEKTGTQCQLDGPI